MPFWMFVRLKAAALRRAGDQAGFSTAEGLAGAALAVVALIAIWAAMRAFGLDIIRWMQDQITSQG
jgi:hypothetical protein